MMTKMMFRRLSSQALHKGNTVTIILKVSNLRIIVHTYNKKPVPSLTDHPPSLYYPHILVLPWKLSLNQ